MGLALLASLISIRVGISVALVEILVGIIAGNYLGVHTTPWIDFLATFGSGLLTFLAGAEIDPGSLKRHLKPALAIGAALWIWLWLWPRLPEPAWKLHVAAEPLPAEMDTAAERDRWVSRHWRVRSAATLEKVVLKLLAKRQEARYQSPAELLADLEPVAEKQGVKV